MSDVLTNPGGEEPAPFQFQLQPSSANETNQVVSVYDGRISDGGNLFRDTDVVVRIWEWPRGVEPDHYKRIEAEAKHGSAGADALGHVRVESRIRATLTPAERYAAALSIASTAIAGLWNLSLLHAPGFVESAVNVAKADSA